MSSKTTCFWLQYDPSLNSVACSNTELSISERFFRDQVKCRSPKKLKSFIGVPNVVHMNVHVLSFNMILISSQWCVLTPSYPFLGKFGLYGKGSFSEKAKKI